MAVLQGEPPELSRPQSGIPPGLERIVRHCLEKSPEARAHSAHDLAFQLGTPASFSAGSARAPSIAAVRGPFMRPGLVAILGVAAVIVVAVVAVIVMWRRPADAGVKRLAVLPFENLGSKEDDYFADGITDEVRGKLTDLPGLEVIARVSSNGYRKTQKTPQEIGKELDVEYLLDRRRPLRDGKRRHETRAGRAPS